MLKTCIFRGVIYASRTRSTYRIRTTSITTRASMDQICVFGATPQELKQAQEQLSQQAPLTSGNGKTKTSVDSDPPSTCTLTFHSTSDTSTINDTNGSQTQVCGSFAPAKYFSTIDTSILGRTLFTAAATPSTQAIIQNNISKLPNGVLFVADKQFGGKGRGGNTWESPAGCIMFSTAFKMTISGQRLPFVQYLVTLAVVQAAQAQAYTLLEHYFNTNTSDSTDIMSSISRQAPLDIKIKWPNDVYSSGLKLGGILCHSSFRDGQFHVIMGVGLNVSNRQPTTCIEELIEKKIEEILLENKEASGGEEVKNKVLRNIKVSRESLLADVMTRLEPMLLQLAEHGFKPFESEYYAAWLHSGQHVQLEEPSSSGGGGGPCGDGQNQMRTVGVTVRGLSPHGYLMAEDDAGEVYELHPDGNSFDFFKGLVRKKINIESGGGY